MTIDTCGFCGWHRNEVTLLVAAADTAVCDACGLRLAETKAATLAIDEGPSTSGGIFETCGFCKREGESPRVVGWEKQPGHPDPVICHACIDVVSGVLASNGLVAKSE